MIFSYALNKVEEIGKMEKTKLIELLKSLSQKDQKKLLRYHIKIEPKHHEANYLLKLLFAKFNGDSKAIDREDIEAALKQQYPKSKKRLNDLTSELTDFANDFLLIKILNRDSLIGSMTLLRYYQEHNLEKNYIGYDAKVQKMLKSDRDNDFHLHLYNLHQLEIIKNKDNRRTPISLDLVDEHLNLFFIENKLRLACEYVSRKNIINTEPDGETIEFLIEKQTSLKEDDAVKVYIWIYKMLTGRLSGTSEQYYLEIEGYLKSNSSLFAPLVKKVIYEYLMNECINQVNIGNINYAEKYVQHIEKLIEEKLLLINGKIGHIRYRNTVSMALMSNERTNWAEQFITKYREKIDSPDAENIYLFSQAQISLAKADYDGAYETLNQHFTPHDFYHKIGYEKILVKIYYSIEDYQSLKSRLKTFRRYVERQQKLPKNKKELLLTFIEAIRKLVQYAEQDNIEDFDIESFRKRLTSADYLWFKQAIDGKQSK